MTSLTLGPAGEMTLSLSLLVLTLLAPSPTSASAGAARHRHSDAWAMRVDYSPETNVLAGLCRIKGHPCWLRMDTGWVGMALYSDCAPRLGVTTPMPRPPGGGRSYFKVRVRLNLNQTGTPQFDAPTILLEPTRASRTSTGQPISGILGVPFLNVIPVEWNVPARKIVFWLRGRPEGFRHVPMRAIIRCTHDGSRRLIMPVRVHGRRGKAMLDTGADHLYLFDYLISDFPAVGSKQTFSGPDISLRFVPRQVKGLTLGPVTINATIGGWLPGYPTRHTPFPYGLIGMDSAAKIHFFVIGDRIMFIPIENRKSF